MSRSFRSFFWLCGQRLMHLNTNVDLQDHSFCDLSYNEAEGWLQVLWRGFVDQKEAQWGAEVYLQQVRRKPSAFLLNDNSGLRGPWFEGLEWLADVWVPQAKRLGLRYVAHIVQADSHHDILTARHRMPLPFKLQIFQNLEDACHWLASVRDSEVAKQAC